MAFFLLFQAGTVAAKILPGAYQVETYLPMLKGKRVALLINQTSEINGTLLLDTLLAKKVNIKKVFVPEHGSRGTADAGAKVGSGVDAKTGTAIVSLYGNNKKPSAAQLQDIDILVYDLQDVGVRFYTYISTLQYAMEACAENGKILLLLDRPNPMGARVDGPVLDTKLKSFVGMQPIPVVYGMTPGEYASMLMGEKWIIPMKLDLKVIKITGYKKNDLYILPVAPSPNLKNNTAILLYPSLCLFEGTVVSVGRGTAKPFQQWGHPIYKDVFRYSFIPQGMVGASKPLLEGQKCYGELVANSTDDAADKIGAGFSLSYLIKAYKAYPDKEKFFNNFFDKLAGDPMLKKQIMAGISEEIIRKSWKAKTAQFLVTRKKYLLYEE